MKLRRTLRRAAFALLPLLLLLALSELAARVLWRSVPAGDGNLPAHPTRLWFQEPDTVQPSGDAMVRIDRLGLREVPSRGAALRVLTLGDSNIFGFGLPHEGTLHAQLQRALEARGIAADVLCGGVTGYSSTQSLRLLEELGWSLEPRLLVVGNLLSDEFPARQTDQERLEGRKTPWARVEWALLRWSLAWKWFRLRVIESGTGDRVIRSVTAPFVEERPRVSAEDYQRNLLAMAAEAEARGVGLVFYRPPTQVQFGGLDGFTPHGEAMERVAQRCGAPLVDGLALLRRDGRLDAAGAFLDDVHATAAANALYGAGIAAQLAERGWPAEPLVPRCGEAYRSGRR